MSLINYFEVFPEKSQTELRTITLFLERDEKIPTGTYVFTEFFCTDLQCDCQRVLLKVLREDLDTGEVEEVATISYSWADEHDSSWSFIGDEPNPFLDLLHRQAPYAQELMELWYEQLNFDANYALRLARHYEEIRKHCGHDEPSLPVPQIASSAQRGKTKQPRISVALSKEERKSRKKLLAARKKQKRKRPK